MAYSVCLGFACAGIDLSNIRASNHRHRLPLFSWILWSGTALLCFIVSSEVFIWHAVASSVFTPHKILFAVAPFSVQWFAALVSSLMAGIVMDWTYHCIVHLISPPLGSERMDAILHCGVGFPILFAGCRLLSSSNLCHPYPCRGFSPASMAIFTVCDPCFSLGWSESS